MDLVKFEKQVSEFIKSNCLNCEISGVAEVIGDTTHWSASLIWKEGHLLPYPSSEHRPAAKATFQRLKLLNFSFSNIFYVKALFRNDAIDRWQVMWTLE